MKLTPILCSIAMAVLASACAQQPTLEQKLAGKTPAERQAILLQECKDAAPGGRVTPTNAYKSHVQRMNNLCDTMSQEMNPK